MRRNDDVSVAHFDWLVQSRSHNQLSTLKLYKIIEANDVILSQNVVYQPLAQDLAAIAFSLWRAVFLSDANGETGDQLADVKKFLQQLMAHNAVLYQTDFNTREWTFRYYLDNAIYRLRHLSDRAGPKLLLDGQFDFTVTFAKDDWTNAQAASDAAITTFGELITSL